MVGYMISPIYEASKKIYKEKHRKSKGLRADSQNPMVQKPDVPIQTAILGWFVIMSLPILRRNPDPRHPSKLPSAWDRGICGKPMTFQSSGNQASQPV